MNKWARRTSLFLALLMAGALCLIGAPPNAQAATMAGGWEEPVPFSQPAAGWLASGCYGAQQYPAGYYHIGRDYWGAVGTIVRAVGDGTVLGNHDFGAGFARAVFVRHKAADNTDFVVLYGHINSGIAAGTPVRAGDTVGSLAELSGVGSHLHMGLVPDSNYPRDVGWGRRTCPPQGQALDSRPFVDPIAFLAAHPKSSAPPGVSPTQQTVILDYADAVWAKGNGLEYGGWTQETANGSAKAVAVGGDTHLLLDFCDSIWARHDVGAGGWVQETACHSAKAVTVSETGLQMLLDFCGAVWAKRGVGWGGWVQQTGCDGHKAIAVAGDTQVILNACNAVWAKQGIGWGGWNQETACGSAVAIAVGSTGIQALIDGCGSVWARRGIGYDGWLRETGCDGHKAVALGGEHQIIINACDAVWAKTGAGWGGWAEETACGSAKAVAMGSLDRQTILGFDGSIWAKQGIGWGGWAQQAGPWSAKMVEVG